MANPKKRTSKSRRNKRRSHHALKPTQLQICSNCQNPRIPHRVCPHCGYYKGREVIEVED